MIKDHHTQAVSPGALIALQGLGLVLLTLFLFQILSGGKGLLFLGAILGGLFIVWFLQRPYLGVLVILALWITEMSPAFLGVRFLTVPKVVSALLVIPLGLSILHERQVRVLRAPQVKIFLAIGFLFVVSTLWNYFKYPITLLPELDTTRSHMQEFAAHLAFLIFFFYFVTTRQRIEQAVWLVLGVIGVVAVSALLSFMAGGGMERAEASFSLASNANRLAFICLFGTSLVWFYRSHTQTRALKALTLPFLFLLPVTALATGSRSGLLQMAVLAALILKEQKGWSAGKRLRSIFLVGAVALFLLAVVPTTQLTRVTSYGTGEYDPGAESLRNRINRIYVLFDIVASDPIFGVGIGNFRWVAQAFYGVPSNKNPHNSYLWALTAGGIGVLALYLLLFYITYRMLRQLERAGPPELLWLSKGLRVCLILFLVFSAFADFWLSDFLYLIVGLTIAMAYLWQRQQLRPVRIVTSPQPVSR